MDEKLRAIRRRRRRERRVLRRLWKLAPLLLVALAYLLSAGVVKLMEAPRPVSEATPSARTLQLDPKPAPLPRLLSAPDTRPALPEMLSTSILDDEVSGPPEENRPSAGERAPDEPHFEPEDLTPLDLELPEAPQHIAPVPEPGSGVLLAVGLVGVAAERRRGRVARASGWRPATSRPRAARRRK